jgi:lipopolysaccharide transport system ATP-binding protein
MWGSNTKRRGIVIPTLTGTGYIDLEIESLPLLEGTYDLTVALSDMSEIHEYDHWERRTRFNVNQHGIFDEGLVHPSSMWSQIQVN